MYTPSPIPRVALKRDCAIGFRIIHIFGFGIPSFYTFSYDSGGDDTENTCQITYMDPESTIGISLVTAGGQH